MRLAPTRIIRRICRRFFASSATYPIAIMPIWLVWLQFVARVNPLSCEVDALRGMMVVFGK
jgi:ABC-2 type transport system permease protein